MYRNKRTDSGQCSIKMTLNVIKVFIETSGERKTRGDRDDKEQTGDVVVFGPRLNLQGAIFKLWKTIYARKRKE